MVKITVDIGSQYQYAGALTAIEKAAQWNDGHEDEVTFEIDDVQNLVEAANDCARKVTSSFPNQEGYGKEETLEKIEELKGKIETLRD